MNANQEGGDSLPSFFDSLFYLAFNQSFKSACIDEIYQAVTLTYTRRISFFACPEDQSLILSLKDVLANVSTKRRKHAKNIFIAGIDAHTAVRKWYSEGKRRFLISQRRINDWQLKEKS